MFKDGAPETKIEEQSTFERNLTDKSRLKLNALRVAKTNPFGKLKRDNTKRILSEISHITDGKRKLPTLNAWLEKKSKSMGRGYQKRWVIVKGSYLLWSDVQRDIKNPKNIKERNKWNNSVNLMQIKEVKPVLEGKTQRKFKIMIKMSGIKDKKREYLWKCATKEDRDFWVDSLKKHISQMKSMIAYLGTKSE